MIQDIWPLRLDGTYRNLSLGDDDRMLAFDRRNVAVIDDGDGGVRLPTAGEMAELLGDHRADTAYAFSILPPEADAKAGQSGSKVDIGSVGRYFVSIAEPASPTLTEAVEAASGPLHMENVMELVKGGRKGERFAAATGMHLHAWYDVNRLCGRCGRPLVQSEALRSLKCPACGNEVFPRINPVVAVAVTDGDRILLTRYAGRSYKERSIVAGFCEIGETPEQAAAREVMEETGVRIRDIRYVRSQPWGVDGNIMMGFAARLDGDPTVRVDEEELSEALWVDRSDIFEVDDDMSITRSLVIDFKEGRL